MALLNNEKYSLFYQRLSLIYQRPEVKASLEVVLSVFTVTLLIFAAIRPTLTNIASLQKKIEDLDSANKKADNKIAQIFNAQTQLNDFQDKLHLFDEAVPDEFSYGDMAGRIEVMALKHGLTVQTMALPGVKLFGEGKGIGEWSLKLVKPDASKIAQSSVQFVVSGAPTNVRAFIEEMENLDRLTLLNSIIMVAETNVNKTETLKATGQLYFYFYQES